MCAAGDTGRGHASGGYAGFYEVMTFFLLVVILKQGGATFFTLFIVFGLLQLPPAQPRANQ